MKELLLEILQLYKKELTSYASGKKAIPVAYYCGQHATGYTVSELEYYDEQYEESYSIEYYASSYKDAVDFLTKPNGDFHHDHFGLMDGLKDAKQDFVSFIIHKVAQKLENYGLRYESIQWFLYNYKDLDLEELSIKSWGKFGFNPEFHYSLGELRKSFWEYCNNLVNDIGYYANAYEKLNRIKEAKSKRILDEKIKEYYSIGGESYVKIVDFENHIGETVGYTEYDLTERKVSGYKVTCWSSSWLGLGNCNCNNHEPGYSFDFPLTEADVDMLIERQKKINEYNNQLSNLPKGRWIIDYYENWSRKYPDRELLIDDTGCYLYGINCYNSQNYGGTCRCVSHKTDYKKKITIEEAKELLKEVESGKNIQ